MRLSWLENAYSRPRSRQEILTYKVGQANLVLVYDQGSLVGLCTQDLQVSVYSDYDLCHPG